MASDLGHVLVPRQVFLTGLVCMLTSSPEWRDSNRHSTATDITPLPGEYWNGPVQTPTTAGEYAGIVTIAATASRAQASPRNNVPAAAHLTSANQVSGAS